MESRCQSFIVENIEKELHIINNSIRINFHENVIKSNITEFVVDYLALYRSVLCGSKTSSQLTISYYAKCHEVNCKKLLHMNIDEPCKDDILQVLNFYSNSVFNVAQSQTEPITTSQGKNLKRKLVALHQVTLLYEVNETERGLLSIAGGTLCDMYKNSVGKRHFRLRLKRTRQCNINNACASFVHAIRMTKEEKADAPPALVCRDRGGLIVPKLCLLPYIRHVIHSVMQFATCEGIKLHGRHLLKVRTAIK